MKRRAWIRAMLTTNPELFLMFWGMFTVKE